MANANRGEVSFEADSKSWTLKFSVNAICEIEDLLDRPIAEIGAEIASWNGKPEKARVKVVRAVFWGMLRDRHPEITLAQAGDLMEHIGGLGGAFEQISKTFDRAAVAETKGPRPPEAASGQDASSGSS